MYPSLVFQEGMVLYLTVAFSPAWSFFVYSKRVLVLYIDMNPWLKFFTMELSSSGLFSELPGQYLNRVPNLAICNTPSATQHVLKLLPLALLSRAYAALFLYLASPLWCRSAIRAGIFKHSMWARNRVETGLSYRPARLHRLAELVPWNRFLNSLKV